MELGRVRRKDEGRESEGESMRIKKGTLYVNK